MVPNVAVPVQDVKDAEAVSVAEVVNAEIFGLHGPASTTTNETRVAKADTSNLLETILNRNERGGGEQKEIHQRIQSGKGDGAFTHYILLSK
jgi:hypothetical protein